jgi:hypothetical protein
MREKTAAPADKNQQVSPNKNQGLIAKGKNTQQSGTTESALDNRSHRTTLQMSCERTLSQLLDAREFIDVNMRTSRLPPSVRRLHLPDTHKGLLGSLLER